MERLRTSSANCGMAAIPATDSANPRQETGHRLDMSRFFEHDDYISPLDRRESANAGLFTPSTVGDHDESVLCLARP
jgi:hypothetical protein